MSHLEYTLDIVYNIIDETNQNQEFMEVITMSNNELHAVIKELKEFKFLKEESEERISELENTIKSEMRTQEVDKMMIGKCKYGLESQIFNSEVLK